MSFLESSRLYLLVIVIIAAVIYVLLQNRRNKTALKFSSAELLKSVMPKSPGIKRHIPAVFFLLAMSSLITAFAKPYIVDKVATEKATIILAIDVSNSMGAKDVQPSRFEAAQAAIIDFAGSLPKNIELGLISFSGNASMLVAPTEDHQQVVKAVERLELSNSTAIGDAIVLGVNTIVDSQETTGESVGHIILLSDGISQAGTPESEAITVAQYAKVPVSTISFGTPNGVISLTDPRKPELGAQETPVPVSEENLATIARQTQGQSFKASSLSQLSNIYDNIGTSIAYEDKDREITDRFVGIGLVLLTASGILSLFWFQRLP